MRRGTTPTFSFKLNELPVESIDKVRITFHQNHHIRLEKTEKDVRFTGGKFFVTLTEEESYRFLPGEADVQFRCSTKGGDAFASPIYHISVNSVINNEVLTDGI